MSQIEVVSLASDGHASISIPTGLRADVAAPLVVSLHYGGPVSPGYGRGLLEQVVEPGLEKLGAIMVAPDCGADAWAEAPCVAALTHAIEYVQNRYTVDMARMVLVGYSKGGIGTWALANSHAPPFCAAIVMAGRPPEPLDAAAWNIPLYAIQAEADELFPVGLTADAISTLQQHGVNAHLQVLDGVTHFETGRFVAPLRETVPWLQQIWQQ